MSHPPPPGTNLPARPPASTSRPGFRSSFNTSNQPPAAPLSTSSYANANSARVTASSYPAAAAAAHYGSSYAGYPASGVNRSASAFSYPQQHQAGNQQHRYPQHQQHQQHQHQQQPQAQSYAPHAYSQQQSQSYQGQSYQIQPYQGQQYQAAPRIQNPFPTPSAAAAAATVAGPDYDPDMAAQIAQWQSAYGPRETDKDGKPVPAPEYAKPEVVDPAAQTDKKKTVVREGGGKKWTDDSLLEWDPSHLRLFVGNLAGETTDESLLKAFSRWKSVQKARVIRDKRTTKSKGYGFVSFSDADDFFQAAKEMHGKYIQSHPVVVKKANTEIKATNVKNKQHHGNNKNKGGSGSGNQGGGRGNDSGVGSYEPNLGPRSGSGVTKAGQKTKNGLRLLG